MTFPALLEGPSTRPVSNSPLPWLLHGLKCPTPRGSLFLLRFLIQRLVPAASRGRDAGSEAQAPHSTTLHEPTAWHPASLNSEKAKLYSRSDPSGADSKRKKRRSAGSASVVGITRWGFVFKLCLLVVGLFKDLISV